MKIHIVKNGESLYSISKKYDVPLEELIKMNLQLKDPNEIDVGMKIKVPSSSHPQTGHEIVHKHVVKEGDTLWKLSKAWGVPLQEMIEANPQLKNPNVLVIGQVVNIPKISNDAAFIGFYADASRQRRDDGTEVQGRADCAEADRGNHAAESGTDQA